MCDVERQSILQGEIIKTRPNQNQSLSNHFFFLQVFIFFNLILCSSSEFYTMTCVISEFLCIEKKHKTKFNFFFIHLDRHHLNQSMINKVNDKIHVKFEQDEKLKNNVINLLRIYSFLIRIIKHQLIISMYSNRKFRIHISHFSFRPQQAKYIDKVMIPQEDHPEVNFVGLIIGPRGNTLKTLEKDVSLSIYSFNILPLRIFSDQCQNHHSR